MSYNLAYALLADAAYDVGAEDLQYQRHPIVKFNDGRGGLWTVVAASSAELDSGYQGPHRRHNDW